MDTIGTVAAWLKKLGFILTLLLSLYSDFALTFAANANCYNK